MGIKVTKAELKRLERLKNLREEKNVRLGDLARELGMSQGQLSMHESGVRGFTTYSLDAFIEDYECAIQKISGYNDEYEVDRDGLEWKRVTFERLQKAREMHSKGIEVVKISIVLGVDGDKLQEMLLGTA